MTFTDEQMQEFDANQTLALGMPMDEKDAERLRLITSDVPVQYAHLTPSEQAEAVDEDNREEERERQARAFLMGPDAYWR